MAAGTLGASAVVAVIAGRGVGMAGGVAVGVGAMRVGIRVTWPTLPVGASVACARSASRVDINPVNATYSPISTTNRTIKKPKAYPLLMAPIIPLLEAISKSMG